MAGPRARRTFSSPVAAVISPVIEATSAVTAAIVATVPLNPPSDGAATVPVGGSVVTGGTVTVGGGGEVARADVSLGVVAVVLDVGAVGLGVVMG